VVAWDVAEVESAEIAAELVQRACLKERYCRPRGFGSRQGHQQPLILHADNGNAMRAATLESRLEELGVLRSFSRPRVSNDNPYSESLFRTVKFRPDYTSRPFASKAEACEWVAASSSSHLTNVIAVPPSPSAGSAPRSTKGSPGPPKTLEPIHSMLAPTSSGVDQQAI
jgi:transposase InsO family protein